MKKSPTMGRHPYHADPLATTTTAKAPAAGASKASKTSGSFGGTSEGKASGKSPNKPR